jgi:hypothetical protein
VLGGWRVLLFDSPMIRKGEAIKSIMLILKGEENVQRLFD